MQGAQEPDDVASETFLSVFRGVASFAGSEEQFRSWVFTIAHRRLVDERRRRSRRPVTTELDHDPLPRGAAGVEDTVIGRLQTEHLATLLDGLTDGQRDVLLLRIVAGFTIEETAIALGRAPGAVKQLQRRGLLRLQKQLAKQGVTP